LDTVAALSPESLEADRLIEATAALGRVIAYAQALQVRLLVRFARLRPAEPGASRGFSEFAADELAPALRISRNAAAGQLALATQLTERLPATLAALEAGVVDLAKARVMADVTAPVSVAQAAQVEERVLARAPRQTAPQLRASARRAILSIDPNGAQARHRYARAERRVTLFPLEDGMAELRALLPAEDAIAVYRRLDIHARWAQAPGDRRSADNRRADALVDLVVGTGDPPTGHGGPGRAGGAGVEIQVTVPATSLLGMDDQPGELAGYGPVPAAVARELAADGTWRRLLTDPVAGKLVEYGRTTYRPSAALGKHVRARDATCRFPGCRHPARHCDLDHTVPYPAGPTSADNLGSLCRHHHRLKHQAGWTVTQDDGAVFTWTSPTGRRYSTTPGLLSGQCAARRAEKIAPAEHQSHRDNGPPEPTGEPPPF